MGELILFFVVVVYFCYGLYALYRESGQPFLRLMRDLGHRMTIGFKDQFSRTEKNKQIRTNLAKRAGTMDNSNLSK